MAKQQEQGQEYRCPKCGNGLERLKSKKGNWYWRCLGPEEECDSIYYDNDGVPQLEEKKREAAPEDVRCPECGGAMVVVPGVEGRYPAFFSCSGYPGCKGSIDILPGTNPPRPAPQCPGCGKRMRLRHGKRGDFLGCSGYPECDRTMEVEEARRA